MHRSVRGTPVLALVPILTLALAQPAAAAAPATQPAVLHVGQIDRQDIPTQAGCEKNTLVEPDIAVSPLNPSIMVAAAHDCRFANGGAVDISYAWTHDGGAHWHHAPVPGVTTAVGGRWDRASDPVVAFGPDGSVYISILDIALTCPSGVSVSRSTDGGETFSAPVLAHYSSSCTYSDDKNWLVIDTHPSSPHYGRLYQFWTPFIYTAQGVNTGSPQVVRWSDDHGQHWSDTHDVTAETDSSQDSQPMIQPDGTITDVYLHFATPTSAVATLRARTSHDGGATWSGASVVSGAVGGGPSGVRCCLPAGTADPVTGGLYEVWLANAPGEPVVLSHSTDGIHWSAPVAVSHSGSSAGVDHVNAAVAAENGNVFVAFGTVDTHRSNLVQQQLSTSHDGGTSFGAPLSVGPLSNLRYAAQAGGRFPGDYIGISATPSVVAMAWCVSSRPADPNQEYHQVVYAAELRP